jgi:hypothetical protein
VEDVVNLVTNLVLPVSDLMTTNAQPVMNHYSSITENVFPNVHLTIMNKSPHPENAKNVMLLV